MIRVFLICLACCCSSLMPLKQSESILSEDHTQVIERKSKNNYFSGQDGVNFVSSDFLSYDFGRIFYDYVKDFESPLTENLSYNRSYNPINYEFISDTPIGHLHMGGFSSNLINNYQFGTGALSCYGYIEGGQFMDSGHPNNSYFFDVNLTSNTTYTLSFTALGASTSSDTAYVYAKDNNNIWYYLNSFNRYSSNVITFNKPYQITQLAFGLYSYGQYVNINTSTIMLNIGSSALPYEPYFTGVVQYASLPCYSFTLDKELVTNSQYNGYCYHYVLKFYSRNPNGRPLLFGVDSYVIPHLKWEDNQGNLYGDNFYVVSNLIFNSSLNYNVNNLVYSERSDDSYKPLTNCYVNNRTREFSSDDYVIAYNDGYDIGYNNGNTNGYQRGYSEGVSYAQEQSSTALTIFTGIIEVGLLPVNVFLKMFEYEVFGINIAGLVSGLITIAMIMILLRFIFGGKQNG